MAAEFPPHQVPSAELWNRRGDQLLGLQALSTQCPVSVGTFLCFPKEWMVSGVGIEDEPDSLRGPGPLCFLGKDPSLLRHGDLQKGKFVHKTEGGADPHDHMDKP